MPSTSTPLSSRHVHNPSPYEGMKMPAGRPNRPGAQKGCTSGRIKAERHHARIKREGAVLSLLNFRIAAWSLGVCFMTSMSANAGLLPERVEKAAQERIAAGAHQKQGFGAVEGVERGGGDLCQRWGGKDPCAVTR